MAFRDTLNASPTTFGEVLSNGKRYIVPLFQRDYAWGETEWAELWSDLLATESDGPDTSHFLGALVLQPTDLRTFNVIDGQQRLVTLSILALAVIARLSTLPGDAAVREANLKRVQLLRERFVSVTDSASLAHHSRLRLGASGNDFYQLWLVQGRTPPTPKTLKGAERRLWECFEFFSKRLGERADAADGAALAHLLGEVAADQLSFIEVRVVNDVTAFTVFETLNARGVALSTADLIKNYLLSLAAQGGAGTLELARSHWERVVGYVGSEGVASLLFHRLSSTVRAMREKQVFVEVKRHVNQGAGNVFEFLAALESSAKVYAALDDPDDDFWQQAAPDARRWVRVLSTLRAEQYKSVVLAAFDKLGDRPEKLTRLLHNLAMISVRAIIAKVHTGDLQRAYQDAAFKIERAELKSPAAIARALSAVTPADDDFRAAFESLEIDPKGQRKRFLRYILSELECQKGGRRIEFEADGATVEHILPENPSAAWDSFTLEQHARDHVRLGNLTPLEAKLNRDLGASSFDRKRQEYARSQYALTQGITASEWTPQTLRARQAEMARLAVQVWRVPSDDGG